MRTLVVDDDLVSRRLLRSLVTAFSECEVAVNGRDALQLFESRHATGTPFELICLDVMLPELDGYEVLEAIRKFEAQHQVGLSQCAKIIFFTSVEDPQLVGRSYAIGCQAMVAKPVDRDKLIHALGAAGISI